MLPAGRRILPVDIRLGPTKRLRRGPGGPAQTIPAGPDRLAQEPSDQLVAIGHRPRPVHRRAVNDGRQTALEDPGLHRLGQRRFEQLVVGVMGDHAGPHQTERPGRDPLEIVIDPHGRLPIGVHPGPPRRLRVRGGAVMGGAQHGPDHHRRRDRRPPHPLRVQLGEIVVTEDLMAMLGQPLIKRALRHQMPAHHPSLQQRTLRINPAQHTPKSIPPATQSGGPPASTLCRVT